MSGTNDVEIQMEGSVQAEMLMGWPDFHTTDNSAERGRLALVSHESFRARPTTDNVGNPHSNDPTFEPEVQPEHPTSRISDSAAQEHSRSSFSSDLPPLTILPHTSFFGAGPPPRQGIQLHRDLVGVEFVTSQAAHGLVWFSTVHLQPLRITKPSEPTPPECYICADSMKDDDAQHHAVEIVGIPGCKGHIFGKRCIVNWLTHAMPSSKKCPICRTELLDVDEDGLLQVRLNYS